jgi:TetR/AcrR family transcriptional repressor of nem operon
MKYPSDHKANTRQRVLQEAARAIRADGVGAVAIAPIMAAAGLTVGGFYAHFRSKDDLVAEAVNFMFEARYSSYFERMGTSDPARALGRFVDYYLSVGHLRDMAAGCPIPSLVGQVPHLPPAAQNRFLLGVERLTQRVADLVAARGMGDAGAAVSSSIAEMIGTLSLARLQTDEGDVEALLELARRSVKRKLMLETEAPA